MHVLRQTHNQEFKIFMSALFRALVVLLPLARRALITEVNL